MTTNPFVEIVHTLPWYAVNVADCVSFVHHKFECMSDIENPHCLLSTDRLSHGQDRERIDQLPDEQSYQVPSSLVSRVEFRHCSDFVRGSGLQIFSSHLTEPIVLPTQRIFVRLVSGGRVVEGRMNSHNCLRSLISAISIQN